MKEQEVLAHRTATNAVEVEDALVSQRLLHNRLRVSSDPRGRTQSRETESKTESKTEP